MILALDQGTTSSRAIVFDHCWADALSAQKEFRQIFPQAGWVEHDPREIWACQFDVARQAIATAGDFRFGRRGHRHHQSARNHGALGPPNWPADLQRDRLAGPPHRALCDQFRRPAGHEQSLQQKTGLVIDPYFSATKIRWLLDHVDGARQTCRIAATSPSAPSTPGCCGT